MSELGLPVIRTQDPAPLEGQDVPYGTGAYANFRSNMESTLGYSLATRFLRGRSDEGPRAEEAIVVPHDEAVQQMKAQGYDASVLPSGDVTQKVINSLAMQQSDIAKNRDLARRARLGGTTEFVTGLAGGGSDPLFLGLGPLGKVAEEGTLGIRALVSGVKASELSTGGGLVSRTLTGAYAGASVMGEYTEGQKLFGTAPGDRDITSYDLLRQMGYGAVLGGGVKAGFGQRLTLGTTARLEGSANAAPLQGVTEANVVSPKGAIGRYQIMPDTARQYMGKDFDVQTLHDPKVNEHVAQKILDDLNEKFPNDPEAQAVAFNAGPGRAKAWIEAGRDDTKLPAETQGYLKRLRGMNGEAIPRVTENPVEEAASLPADVKTDAAKASVAQVMADSDVNVEPVIQNGLRETTTTPGFRDEQGIWRPWIDNPEAKAPPPPLEDALPKPGSAIINDRLNTQMLDRINAAHETAPKPAAETPGENPELAGLRAQVADALKQAEHAHQMAFGENGKPFKEVMGAHIEEHASGLEPDDRAMHEAPDLAKAVDAAVRCSIVKGVE